MAIKINLHFLMWLQIGLLFGVRMITSLTGLNQIVYICDLISILMLLSIIRRNKQVAPIAMFFIVEIIYWCISFYFGISQSTTAFVLLLRVFVRFFIIFIAAQLSMKKTDYLKLFKILDYIFFIHFALVLFQIFIMKVPNGDAVGGIFGVVFGYGNGSSHTLIILVTLVSVFNHFSNRESVRMTIIKIAMSLSIAMLTEMKSFIYEVFFIVVLFVILEGKIKLKTGLIIIAVSVVAVIFMNYMGERYNFSIFSSESINTYFESGYADNPDGVNRTDGYEKVFEVCFNKNKEKAVLGYGFSTSVSSFTELNFGEMNLGYFTYAKMFYDVGIIGSILYFIPFIACIIQGVKLRKTDKRISTFCVIFGIICVYLNFYGSHMESDFTGYLYYIMLSFPLVIRKEVMQNECGSEKSFADKCNTSKANLLD